MKNLHYLIILIIPFLLFSCEEDVVINLGKIQKRLVVEAKVTNGSPTATVALSYSQDFYDTPDTQLITNATVQILAEMGESETLSLNSKDIFTTSALQPNYGKNYTLKVKVDGQEIEATTTLPLPVKITNVSFVPNPFSESNDSINIYVSVADPIEQVNYYRLKVNKKGAKPSGEYYLMDDSYGNGQVLPMPVYYKNFKPGDTVIVELDNLSKNLYQYYSSLSENVNGSFNSIAPGNPTSNMPDNVYGYFGGYAITRDTVIARLFQY